ncbi:hypothetical protein SDC9_91924 [bioreactor metagenome]|uniref:Uncharacterized protein n=1 Tax=bioreactor metagenome TaxID=1076179 RepID=A0A644ZXU3_9ZZZZ
MQKITNTFGFRNTGHLDKNTFCLVEALNVGRNHTETVDTCAEHIKRVIGSAFYFLPEDSDYLVVGCCRGDPVTHSDAEDICQFTVGIYSFVVLTEKSDEIG